MKGHRTAAWQSPGLEVMNWRKDKREWSQVNLVGLHSHRRPFSCDGLMTGSTYIISDVTLCCTPVLKVWKANPSQCRHECALSLSLCLPACLPACLSVSVCLSVIPTLCRPPRDPAKARCCSLSWILRRQVCFSNCTVEYNSFLRLQDISTYLLA